MTSKNYIYLIVLLSVINFTNLLPQQSSNTIIPEISILSAGALFIDTVEVNSYILRTPSGEIIQPVATFHKYMRYAFRLILVIHEKGNIIPMPLNVKIISPKNVINIYPLEKDIADLNIKERYYYNLEIETEESGWFTVELVSFNNTVESKKSTKKYIFDKTQTYFKG